MGISRREFSAGAAGVVASISQIDSVCADDVSRRSFTPGQVWLDTSGAPIQCHAGSIIKVGDLFYWYGENKERTTGGNGIWHWGIRAYSSRDLYNWDDAGIIIPPTPDDPSAPLHPARFVDRPHILFNRRTGKFVCWLKIMGENVQTRTVLTADAFTGPYTIVRTGILPLGMSAGDFDLVTSPDDAKAYMYFERVHSEMICADLTDDYADFSGYYSTHFPSIGPPSVREGPAYFRRGAKHYLATSGTTGYYPNPSQIAAADTFHGPWRVIGDLHRADRTGTSFNSQISSVFKHPHKRDLYIALADRWFPDLGGPSFESGDEARLVQSAFSKLFAHPPQALSESEQRILSVRNDFGRVNTSLARYVWLPIQFRNDRPIIEWRDEWTLDEFE